MRLIPRSLAVVLVTATVSLWSTPSTAWEPTPEQIAKLGPRQTFDSFSVRPPRGFVLSNHHSGLDGKLTTYSWTLPNQKNSFFGGFNIAKIVTPPHITLDDALEFWSQNAFEKHLENITQSTPRTDEIDGAPFLRMYYKGNDKQSHRLIHGFVYIGIEDGVMYQMDALDYDESYKRTLTVAEAAVLSFKLSA